MLFGLLNAELALRPEVAAFVRLPQDQVSAVFVITCPFLAKDL